ncbi:glycosyltransferase [Halogeometricum limi]|uniref:Glycosyltransferase, catalytic subunit of cellulose synthase and poly-beta-1,6-N-acetylglucosamine synthase n=1 Tax=Halogeometricum limi TaxID=555875 RepID=A0A1I6I9C2_9EURY|nr:glycosyltransferase family 2 protein [Halogeometricum limi]SFR63306.1 Glycosyltransferase, catalytic subunit of cellulose synthase and poly-beta-1,6-N-acetylglucosamine synthase [Halogeometricum limi]
MPYTPHITNVLATAARHFDGDVFVSFVLWQLLLFHTLPVGYWLYMMVTYAGSRGDTTPPSVHGLGAVQARVLTVDAEAVVQRTVDSLPEGLDDVLVVAEKPIDVRGARVVVVPETFECEATNKGRAVEWARRAHPTDKEYVLYLDEDTLVGELDGIPDADVVQFRERPQRTGSLLAYLAEIHRVGFNTEQRGFGRLRYPLYAWGGGVAIRRSLEDRVTWDVETIVEDSVFVWRALDAGATFHVSDVTFHNQAPPSVRSMVGQRRRWLTGTRMQRDLLPYDYQLLYYIRDFGWATSVFAPFLWFLSVLDYAGVVPLPLDMVLLPEVYFPLTMILLTVVYGWSVLGLVLYRERPAVWALLLLTTPLVVLVHSLGAFYGMTVPVTDFQVTEKAADHDDSATDVSAD